MSNKITFEHLNKNVYIYIRQSSPGQVKTNTASQEVQRNLKNRALLLGWKESQIKILDEDLGTCASLSGIRSDFQSLIQKISKAQTGALFFLEASRLARNGKEWCHALEVCTIFNVLIIDRGAVYDPALPGDRMNLGMQGVFSEYEVNQLRLRAREAIELKASKGELIIGYPPAYIKTEDGRLEKTPDERIREAIDGVFTRFDKLGSVNQVFNWYFDNNIELPVRDNANGHKTLWRIPSYKTVHNILTDPIYAGTYMYPKTKTRIRFEDGKIIKTSGHRVTEADKPVLIYNHFDSYISKEQFDKNIQIISNNCLMSEKTSNGAPREGNGILTGLLRCRHCSRTLRIRYNKSKKQNQIYHYYYCPYSHEFPNVDNLRTLHFNGAKLEQIVSEEIIKAVQPYAIEAAIVAEEKYNQANHEKLNYLFNSIEQAQYEAQRIERQYNKVEPENRLVASTLEQRWQKALEKVNELQEQYDNLASEQQSLTARQREQLFELPGELPRVWNDPKCNYREKTRLIRLLITEIWVEQLTPTKLKAIIHWEGGVHTAHEFLRRTPSKNPDKEIVIGADIIKELAKTCDDEQIVRILNRANSRPEKRKKFATWTKALVEKIRCKNNIPEFSVEDYKLLGIVNLQQASEILNASMETVLQLIAAELIDAKQVIKYAPWQIAKSELTKPEVRRYIRTIQTGKKKSLDKNQLNLI